MTAVFKIDGVACSEGFFIDSLIESLVSSQEHYASVLSLIDDIEESYVIFGVEISASKIIEEIEPDLLDTILQEQAEYEAQNVLDEYLKRENEYNKIIDDIEYSIEFVEDSEEE